MGCGVAARLGRVAGHTAVHRSVEDRARVDGRARPAGRVARLPHAPRRVAAVNRARVLIAPGSPLAIALHVCASFKCIYVDCGRNPSGTGPHWQSHCTWQPITVASEDGAEGSVRHCLDTARNA